MRGISVVVPTYNCKALLVRTLDSLSRQVIDWNLFEVIVVDDGSSDGTEDIISGYSENLHIRYFYQEDKGFRVAAARNIGIAHASFPVILFIDAGIVVSSDLLAVHLRLHKQRKPLVVIGTSYGVHDYESRSAELIEQVVGDDIDEALMRLSQYEEVIDSRTRYLQSIDYELSKMPSPWLIFWGGHVSVTTEAIQLVGGFDEWFNRWGGEDNEIGLRLFKQGCEYLALREVKSIHLPHFKDPQEKKISARINVMYIHEKHRLEETDLLIQHNWQCIVNRRSGTNTCAMFGCISASEARSSL